MLIDMLKVGQTVYLNDRVEVQLYKNTPAVVVSIRDAEWDEYPIGLYIEQGYLNGPFANYYLSGDGESCLKDGIYARTKLLPGLTIKQYLHKHRGI